MKRLFGLQTEIKINDLDLLTGNAFDEDPTTDAREKRTYGSRMDADSGCRCGEDYRTPLSLSTFPLLLK
jgi:hypothetical protein